MKALAYILIMIIFFLAGQRIVQILEPVSGYESKNCYELRATSHQLPLECRSK